MEDAFLTQTPNQQVFSSGEMEEAIFNYLPRKVTGFIKF